MPKKHPFKLSVSIHIYKSRAASALWNSAENDKNRNWKINEAKLKLNVFTV